MEGKAVKLGAKIFGILGGSLVLYLLLGLLMPGTWVARQEALVSSPPSAVFPYLNRMDLWQSWAPMPESGSESFGPPEGVDAGIRWDDPQYGRGQIQITGSFPNTEVTYSVEVEGGALRIEGKFALAPEGSGTRIEWEEAGDSGRNPLMGYAARGMSSSQGEAMRISLGRLVLLLEGDRGSPSAGDPETPAHEGTEGGIAPPHPSL
jgi:hypothetical protein